MVDRATESNTEKPLIPSGGHAGGNYDVLSLLSKRFERPVNPAVSFDNLDTAGLYAPANLQARKEQAPATGDASLEKPAPIKGDVSATSDAAASGVVPARQVVPESTHVVKRGETCETIAREKLGPNATADEVTRYANIVAQINIGTDVNKPEFNHTLLLPGQTANGDYTFRDPSNKDAVYTYHTPFSYEKNDAKTGTITSMVRDEKNPDNYVVTSNGPGEHLRTTHKADGSYVAEDLDTGITKEHTVDPKHPANFTDRTRGPKPEDNTVMHRIYKDQNNYTDVDDTRGIITEHTQLNKYGTEWREKYTGPEEDLNYQLTHHADGSVQTDIPNDASSTIKHPDGRTEAVRSDGSKMVRYPDGRYTEEIHDGHGKILKRDHRPSANGDYTETGTGPNPSDNYKETYNITSGVTTRTEATGTAHERTITRQPDGTETVIAKDGNNFERKPDGSEHHFGKENFDKPAYDYNSTESSKKALESSIQNHKPPIAAAEQASMEKDMADFEKRAQATHMPPEEISKSYAQMSRLLDAPDAESKVNGQDRARLAQSFLHQCARPDATDQGFHNSCNVTTVAENGFTRNPSVLAEMTATTALTGQWVAPDGKVIKVDPKNLQPGPDENNYPLPDGNRSYATQILNVVMTNDITQRRTPLSYYREGAPGQDGPNDCGERIYDAYGPAGKVLTYKVTDPKDPSKIIEKPISESTVKDGELSQQGQRLYNREYDVFECRDNTYVGGRNFNSPEALAHGIKQMQDQGRLPVTIAVDGNHAPFHTPQPGYGNHVVTIDRYDEKTGQIHISNQWGSASDISISPEVLYANASGKNASVAANPAR